MIFAMQPDFTPIVAQALKGFLYFLPILLLVAIFKSARFKGAMGEWAVNLASSVALNKNDYHLIKDVTLPTEDGTTQIDHIIVSRFGIFVVETKNMRGWIFGSEHQPRWTQKIFKQSFKFQNPLHQNYKHLKVLEACLGVDMRHLHSVFVFTGDCTFKTPMPNNVVRSGEYIRHIKSKTQAVLSDGQAQGYITAIEADRLERTSATRRAHIQHIKKKP